MNRITELRKKLGLTQQQLAFTLNCSQQSISKYEREISGIPNDMLSKMANYFKVPIDYILSNESEEKKQKQFQTTKQEICSLHESLDAFNRETWIILGKRLLEGQSRES